MLLDTPPLLRHIHFFFFFCMSCYYLNTQLLSEDFNFILLSKVMRWVVFVVISLSFSILTELLKRFHNDDTIYNTQTWINLYCYIVLFCGHIKKNLHLKAAGGCSLVQHEQKEKLSQMQSCIQQIHMQSLVVAVKGSVWKCCSKIKSFISFGGSKNLQSPQLLSVVLYKLWLVWGNLACKN